MSETRPPMTAGPIERALKAFNRAASSDGREDAAGAGGVGFGFSGAPEETPAASAQTERVAAIRLMRPPFVCERKLGIAANDISCLPVGGGDGRRAGRVRPSLHVGDRLLAMSRPSRFPR